MARKRDQKHVWQYLDCGKKNIPQTCQSSEFLVERRAFVRSKVGERMLK